MNKRIIVIIGAPKAGTSLLSELLRKGLPRAYYPFNIKESHCLLTPDVYASYRNETFYDLCEYDRILDKGGIVIDGSTGYATFFDEFLKNISTYRKDEVLLLYCVRDPWQRAVSEYHQLRLHSPIKREELFNGYMKNHNPKHHFGRFLENSDYARVIRYLEASDFDFEVLRFESWTRNDSIVDDLLSNYGIKISSRLADMEVRNQRNRNILYEKIRRRLPSRLRLLFSDNLKYLVRRYMDKMTKRKEIERIPDIYIKLIDQYEKI
jgi:hypothetical protein